LARTIISPGRASVKGDADEVRRGGNVAASTLTFGLTCPMVSSFGGVVAPAESLAEGKVAYQRLPSSSLRLAGSALELQGV
jgi:hypothetical protein